MSCKAIFQPYRLCLPLFPFLAFVLIVLWANRDKKLSAGLAIGGIGLSWILGWAHRLHHLRRRETSASTLSACSPTGCPPGAPGRRSASPSTR